MENNLKKITKVYTYSYSTPKAFINKLLGIEDAVYQYNQKHKGSPLESEVRTFISKNDKFIIEWTLKGNQNE